MLSLYVEQMCGLRAKRAASLIEVKHGKYHTAIMTLPGRGKTQCREGFCGRVGKKQRLQHWGVAVMWGT